MAEGLAQALAFGVAADDGPGRIEQGQTLLGVTEEDRFVELIDQLPVARLAALQGQVGGFLFAQVDVDAIQLRLVAGVMNQQMAGIHPDAPAALALQLQLGRRYGRAATEHELYVIGHLLAHGWRDDQFFQGLAHGFMGGIAI